MARSFWSPVILKLAGVKLKLKGELNLVKSSPYIFVSNHQSFLDIPILFNSLPINLHFIGKEELRKFPFIGWFMKSVGMIFINRNSRSESLKSIEEAKKSVRLGNSLMVFPEGTRTENGILSEFKKGSFLIAKQSKVQMVPIFINNAFAAWSKNSLVINSCPVSINIGQPIKTEIINNLSLKKLAEHVHQEVANLAPIQ